jgi:hypothetical protein
MIINILDVAHFVSLLSLTLLKLVWTWCIMHPSSNNCHRKKNPSKKKKKNKGPGSLTDTENKTHKKKKNKQRSGQFNWHRKQNP